ncbi:Germin-like protein 5-1 [Zea mays]|uniref:Germin-like protein n=1 Tax=Zea mays TaxID=4577 RepID=A0A3L6DWH1_MAIZE|nr:Germin-like protein 5-1 [Zea mays]
MAAIPSLLRRRLAIVVATTAMLVFLPSPSVAGDPDLLQDICVADLTSTVKVNGYACKAAAAVTADDFYFSGLGGAGNTSASAYGSAVTGANVEKVPGLNTLGVSMSRIDYAPGGGLNPPHTHPRATEMVFVLQGTLDVGFVTAANNRLVARTLAPGDVFVFPRGLVHFQRNAGDGPAAVVSAFNSQLPGTQSLAAALFAASPELPDAVLAKAFQVGTKEVDKIKARLAPKKA